MFLARQCGGSVAIDASTSKLRFKDFNMGCVFRECDVRRLTRKFPVSMHSERADDRNPSSRKARGSYR